MFVRSSLLDSFLVILDHFRNIYTISHRLDNAAHRWDHETYHEQLLHSLWRPLAYSHALRSLRFSSPLIALVLFTMAVGFCFPELFFNLSLCLAFSLYTIS